MDVWSSGWVEIAGQSVGIYQVGQSVFWGMVDWLDLMSVLVGLTTWFDGQMGG